MNPDQKTNGLLPAVDESFLQNQKTLSAVPSEIPEAPAKLSSKEKKYWDYITKALFDYGLIHKTDGMLIMLICRTFQHWVAVEEQLSEIIKTSDTGYLVTTPNGFQQPHQLFFVAQKLRKELIDLMLPEAALTIPSFHKVMNEKLAPQQGGLFPEDDPVIAHQRRGTVVSMRDANRKK